MTHFLVKQGYEKEDIYSYTQPINYKDVEKWGQYEEKREGKTTGWGTQKDAKIVFVEGNVPRK